MDLNVKKIFSPGTLLRICVVLMRELIVLLLLLLCAQVEVVFSHNFCVMGIARVYLIIIYIQTGLYYT